MHAYAVGTPDGNRGIGDGQHQPGAVFNRAAVFIRAVVGAVLEKLIEQLAVRAVDLHAIETSALRVFRAAAVGFDDAGDFFRLQRSRPDERPLRPHEANVSGCRDGARRDRQLAIQKNWIGDAADVRELENDATTTFMDRLGDERLPAHLFLGSNTWRIRIADTHRGH